MHRLPNQSFDDGTFDIIQAIAMQPMHISWYKLTLSLIPYLQQNHQNSLMKKFSRVLK